MFKNVIRYSKELMTLELKIEHLIQDDQEGSTIYKGLKNEGTTCYLNSMLQALFYIRPFRNAIY